jgi:putative transposase
MHLRYNLRMTQEPLPQRKSPRLQGYDYSREGAYFVTICTHGRAYLFGDVVDNQMRLNDVGAIADETWYTIPLHHPHVELDAFVVMPNHVHGIIVIHRDSVGTGRAPSVPIPPSALSIPSFDTTKQTLGVVIGAYKSAITKAVNRRMGLRAPLMWQVRFHDHIIRDARELDIFRAYVADNPARWEQDTFYGRGD